MRRLLLSAALLCIFALPAAADLITSTAAGGFWVLDSTWVGGVAPGEYDDVIVAGPVIVTGDQTCRELEVTAAGSIEAGSTAHAALAASGHVINAGVIRNNATFAQLALTVGGDLENSGQWVNQETLIAGSAERSIAMTGSGVFSSHVALAAGAGGDVLAATPLRFDGNLDLFGARLLLGADCPLTLGQGVFKGDMLAAGNEVIFESWSYLQQATLDNVVLVGEVSISWGVGFTGVLTVMDLMENLSSTGNAHVVIEGALVNHGVIRNNSYGFTIALYGDLHNEGVIRNSYVAFEGEGVTHAISMTPDASIETSVFLPEFVASTLVATTPLQFYNGGIGLGSGTMILEPGADLTFEFHGGVGGSFGEGALYANGNSIRLDEYGGIGGGTIDEVVLRGYVAMGADCAFTNGVTVADTLVNRAYNHITAVIEDLLVNEGLISEEGGSHTIVLRSDAANLGSWDNSTVRVEGDVDQAIGAGPGIDVPEFVLVAGIEAAGYQWTRDGVELPGETGSELTLNGVGASDYGVYRCEGAGGELSRAIAIDEFIDPTDATPLAAGLALGQNHPNPFNPATEFRFSIEASGPVKLAVYDVAGREVEVLVDGELAAGDHHVEWRPEGLGSGIYLYRLQAAGQERILKATLLK